MVAAAGAALVAKAFRVVERRMRFVVPHPQSPLSVRRSAHQPSAVQVEVAPVMNPAAGEAR